MEEGDSVDVSDDVEAVEVANVQFKESEIPQCVESGSNLESQRMIIPREGNYPRSTVQEFMDLFDGKNNISNIYFTDTIERPGTSSVEAAEGRVQELTLMSYGSLLGTSNDSDIQTEQSQLWPANQQAGGPNNGISPRLALAEDRVQPTSVENEPSVDDPLIENPAGYQRDLADDEQTGCKNSGGQPFTSEGMRTKNLSGSGFPEYFVKNSLKGKGLLRRPPALVSVGANFRGQGGIGLNGTTVSSGLSLGLGVKSTTVSLCNPDLSTLDSCKGDSLKQWLKSGSNKHKASSLSIFRKILDLVDCHHLEGKVLLDLQPALFKLSDLNEVKYCGRLCTQAEIHGSNVCRGLPVAHNLKRPLDQGVSVSRVTNPKQLKFGTSGCGLREESRPCMDSNISRDANTSYLQNTNEQHLFSVADQLEENWYRSSEEVLGRGCSISSNIYSLGVLLFEHKIRLAFSRSSLPSDHQYSPPEEWQACEGTAIHRHLLGCFEPGKARAAAMSDLRHRIFPPKFLSENLKEAGLCLLLLHPEPSLRPTSRDILQSDGIGGFQDLCNTDMSLSIDQDDSESEILLHFLLSMKEQKHKHASKLEEGIRCIEADIIEVEKRHVPKHSLTLTTSEMGSFIDLEKRSLQGADMISIPASDIIDLRFVKNVEQLESAYFSVRSDIQLSDDDDSKRPDRELLENRENGSLVQQDKEKEKPFDRLGAFFDGLCKYARYSKLEVCGTLRSGEFTGASNVICSLSFDRDEDYFAAAGVSKKIKIFDFQALCNDSVDIHYPATEMTNKSKISCICWNNYVRNYLASTDYDGTVKLWDASTGKVFSEFTEHEKRAWSVDFSRLDPTKLASGSDDCSVKLWSINERNCSNTIKNIANVCCVQFSSHSSQLLAFGSADYKICCYDLRNTNVPWCILSGHEKAVSYVKFLDSATLVSASTDNTLKLWDLSRSAASGLSTNACSSTFRGHTNEKNFVGLSVADEYIACGSETNEVFTYHKSFPMPITSHKFGSIDPISGKEIEDDNGQFVSSVCWRGRSNVIVAANSTGCIKVLRLI
ncbi:SPA1-RELATED 2-like protein [Drosera capensis]